jgi:hypothetical protein
MAETEKYAFVQSFTYTQTVKPPFIIPVHFSALIVHVFCSLNNHPYKERIIILDVLLLKVSCFCVSPSESMVLTHNIPGTIVSEKK